MTFPFGLTIITLWGVCAGLNLVFERVKVKGVRWPDGDVEMPCAIGVLHLRKGEIEMPGSPLPWGFESCVCAA